MARISAHVSPELRAMLTRIQELPTTVRKEVRVQTKAAALPIWQEAVRGHTLTRLEVRLASTARVAVTDRGVRLQAARVGKSLRGGLSIKSQWHAIEFGAEREDYATVAGRSRKGRAYTYKRRTKAQLRSRNRTGYVVFPAVASAVPRIMSLWLQTVARAGHEALEGKS